MKWDEEKRYLTTEFLKMDKANIGLEPSTAGLWGRWNSPAPFYSYHRKITVSLNLYLDPPIYS